MSNSTLRMARSASSTLRRKRSVSSTMNAVSFPLCVAVCERQCVYVFVRNVKLTGSNNHFFSIFQFSSSLQTIQLYYHKTCSSVFMLCLVC